MNLVSLPSNALAPSSPVVLTTAACEKLEDIIAGEGGGLHLRVAIEGGGCSGFQYVFELEDQKEADDLVGQSHGVEWVVDPVSAAYLQGAEVDYEEGLQGARFVVRNPNAKTTCGCGSSFSA